MAARPKSKAKTKSEPRARLSLRRMLLRGLRRAALGLAVVYGVLILLFSFVPPPINFYQLGESWRLGGITKDWVSFDQIAPVMALTCRNFSAAASLQAITPPTASPCLTAMPRMVPQDSANRITTSRS